MSSHLVITGASGGSTAGALQPNRLEINTFVKNAMHFSLFVQALADISNESESILTSFYQMGGIHGLPYAPWNGSGGSKPVATGRQWDGYCTHGSMIFPTWHRPYVSLIEQVIQKRAIEIAATYTVNKDQWTKAAADLRLPYWDWAAPNGAVPPPEVIEYQQVTITGPDGQQKTVDNPLFAYRFQSSVPDDWPLSQYGTTLRHPTSDDANATSDVESLREEMESRQEQITSSIYHLMTRVRTWSAFSNHSAANDNVASSSVEGIHDNIHVAVGGSPGDPSGHMADPAIAAFDPIFFLHHANVDRMLSLWSALNPGVWVVTGPSMDGTWTIPHGKTVGPQTDLAPFWNTQTTYWISTKTTATGDLGYSYPEFNGLDMGNKPAVQRAIQQIVQKLYGGFVFSTAAQPPLVTALAANPAPTPEAARALPQAAAAAPTPHAHAPLAAHTQAQAPMAAHTQTHAPAPVHNPTYNDWAVRIHVEKYALGGTFSILVFLGPVPHSQSPREWRRSPSYVGAHSVFVNSTQGCVNCQHQAETHLVAEGYVHLNGAIARNPTLDSLDAAVVTPYLRDHLSVRVVRSTGEIVDPATLSSLEVLVCLTPMTQQPGADLPSSGEPQYFPDIHVVRGRE